MGRIQLPKTSINRSPFIAMSVITNNPKSGRLATTEDFEQALGIDLQAMLNLTSNHALNTSDAWASGNTDNAFAINNFVGVQRSHRDNDWNYGWIDLANEGRGTYVYMPLDPYVIKPLTPLKLETAKVATIPIKNTGHSTAEITQSYTETESQTTSIIQSTTVGLKMTAEIDILGSKFGFEASMEATNSKENSKTKESSSTTTIAVSVPANSECLLEVTQYTSSQVIEYGLDLVVGSDNPTGSIGKCTGTDQGRWDKFWRVEDVLKGREKQTVIYQVETVSVKTNVDISDSVKLLAATGNALDATNTNADGH
ncbi:hypothetical protein QFC22_005610 [Naganishia vaughanmartiniae]|uniref:Uncharacterized protein n=1 Tax=Naganishia vaughanmartiniae TaxID=1424756 RepID=A0ACC2WUC3_9TREE|nr:hypothetical protein QFC22_005610 [Naganishia vaughanmartiniae]